MISPSKKVLRTGYWGVKPDVTSETERGLKSQVFKVLTSYMEITADIRVSHVDILDIDIDIVGIVLAGLLSPELAAAAEDGR